RCPRSCSPTRMKRSTMISNKRTLPVAIPFLALIAASNSGCGGGSSAPPISVSVSPISVTVQSGTTAQFTASVLNDTAGKGVTWTVSCSAAPCGSVLPTSTQSGMPTTYTAPATPPTSNLSITLTGTSITDITKSATVTVTVPSVGITVNPPTATVMAGGTSQLTATLTSN